MRKTKNSDKNHTNVYWPRRILNKMSQPSVHIVFPHQLFEDVMQLPHSTTIILVEDDLFYRHYHFHAQKLILHRASMQVFKTRLEDTDFSVIYIETSPSRESKDALEAELKKLSPKKVSYYDVVDDWLERRLEAISSSCKIRFDRLNSPAFLTTRGQLDDYFSHQPNRMQQFYQWQRRRLDVLMNQDGSPVGGKWSYDDANRKKLPSNVTLPRSYLVDETDRVSVDEATQWVGQHFPDNLGSSESFKYPVSHRHAEKWLRQFVVERLNTFGPYEDAISKTETELFHSKLSPLLNIGLLTPQGVLDVVIEHAESHQIAIESLEGFIRQLIGWREYMRATYLRYGREMRTSNHLKLSGRLARCWWDGTTGLEPVDVTIKRVLDTGYAHHIERLMILGNAMLLMRIHPDYVYEWFMSLFIDAYDWVMVPNVYAMSQFAAGEKITTKPYVSGSNYIRKMSNYSKGDWTNDWDALYWCFVRDFRETFEKNYRSSMMVKLYDKMPIEKKQAMSKRIEKYVV